MTIFTPPEPSGISKMAIFVSGKVSVATVGSIFAATVGSGTVDMRIFRSEEGSRRALSAFSAAVNLVQWPISVIFAAE